MEPSEIQPAPPSPITISERQWAIGLHLSALLGFSAPLIFNIAGPLVIWFIKKPDSAYLDAVGKRVLNFQISYSLYAFIATSVGAGLGWTIIFGFIGVVLGSVIAIMWLVCTILGAIKESNGEAYVPPLVIKFFA